jgi:RimJ/RimL family protein N-acetyltransferase
MTACVQSFMRPRFVTGIRLRFREALPEDAHFVLKLRLDPKLNQFLSRTPPDLSRQTLFIERCRSDPTQIYFIIERVDGTPIGTVRLYDLRDNSFEWGSWILASDAPAVAATESTLLVYHYALACGFSAVRGRVQKNNVRVWRYHERYGGVRIGESSDDYFYAMSKAEVAAMVERYRKFLRAVRIEI